MRPPLGSSPEHFPLQYTGAAEKHCVHFSRSFLRTGFKGLYPEKSSPPSQAPFAILRIPSQSDERSQVLEVLDITIASIGREKQWGKL